MTVVESAKMTQEWWLFVTNLIENYNLQLPSGNFSEYMVKGKSKYELAKSIYVMIDVLLLSQIFSTNLVQHRKMKQI